MEIRANALAVMAKAPVAGQVKTRLLPLLSAEEAAELSRSLLVDQLKHLLEFDAADFYLAFAPDDARSLMENLAPPCFQPISSTRRRPRGPYGGSVQKAFRLRPQKYRPDRRRLAAGASALFRRGL